MGDRDAGGAAVPGHDQRAGAALRHGRGAAGKARQLSRHAVSATTALRAQLVPPEPCSAGSSRLPQEGLLKQSLSIQYFTVVRHSKKQLCLWPESHLGLSISANKQTKPQLCVTE